MNTLCIFYHKKQKFPFLQNISPKRLTTYIICLLYIFGINQKNFAQNNIENPSPIQKKEKKTEIIAQNKYFVQFKDKENNGYTLEKPEKFLSQKSIQRRKNQNIALDWRDLPVNQMYVKELSKNGAKVWYVSKWFNGAMIEISKDHLEKIKKLAFVKENTITYLAPATSHKSFDEKTQNNFQFQVPQKTKFDPLVIENKEDYGKSFNQNNMLGAQNMHKKGFRGKDITIAVFDAGFANGNKVPFLKHLFENKQILGTFDFVTHQPNVYRTGEHGLQVLSTIASYQKGKIIGTAPEAFFYLFRTEDANTEYKSEEINWVVAAEQADSLGVDVINSSLGYNDFDDSKMDYTYKDMNGKTSFASQSATWAAKRGIIVCNSAGNEGEDNWRYIGVPADADSIVAVGATNPMGEKAGFSSFGPTSDNRIKPLISAQGSPAITGSPSGNITSNSGTSFSSPIIAGFMASVWSAYPQLTAQEVIELVKNSGDQALKPDNKLGYGIPHFDKIEKIMEKKKK